ncbi:MAG: type I restriction enzyme HsdR N-terminal domain-containing protein, partial [Thermomicrobiales bacterium]|nr:type I restriction enzyme HsdR N-terminal domain-containing protein [Thermomicrobiales bacterium]
MEKIILDIQEKLRQNRFPNEASISQGIVLRIIRSLGWNVDDIDVVWPEFATGSQRADYALCQPAGKPVVLIEVKQPGTLSVNAEEQLAEYAYRQGVPLVVLTSGQDWLFYAPYGPGRFSDRRIYRLDLIERNALESEERLSRYLSYHSWVSGQASLSVQEDLKEMLGKQETRRRLPEAWQSLLEEPNPNLVELLTEQLEKQTGSEPPKGEVVT